MSWLQVGHRSAIRKRVGALRTTWCVPDSDKIDN